MQSSCVGAIASLLPILAAGLIGAPPPAAVSAFNSYAQLVEARLDQQHRAPESFLASPSPLNSDGLVIEQLAPASGDLPGASLHHWRGTAFAPQAKGAHFERILRDVDAYPRHFSPQVLQAQVLMRDGDRMQTRLRVRQRNIIAVVMDVTCDVTFVQLDPRHGYSTSRSTQISEISPGSEDHGFLWRLNTYWSYEERDGGLYLQIEAVSLTRSVPHGLAWLIQPWVRRIPAESLEFTLRSVLKALRN